MNLFQVEDYENSEGLTEGQIKKKKLKRQSQRLENEPIFTGKVNVGQEDVQRADEIWLIKVPKIVRSDRLEGHEIITDESAANILELNDGVQVETKVEKHKFKLPFVFPKSEKDLVATRIQEGLQAERAFRISDKFEGTEEHAETCSVSFKGTITISKHVDIGKLPKPKPEFIEKVPQPNLKIRHPFFGLEEPPTPVQMSTLSSPSKNTRKRKKEKR